MESSIFSHAPGNEEGVAVSEGPWRTLKLRRNQERRVLAGHPWVFSNELEPFDDAGPGAGEIVQLVSSKGRFVATAYYNPATLIACRILSRTRNPDIPQLIRSRLAEAIRYRKRMYPLFDDLRIVYSESDNLPGLIVDRYGSWLSVQVQTAGMERLWPAVLNSLHELLKPEGVVIRADSAYRTLEGLSRERWVVKGDESRSFGKEDESGAPIVTIGQHGLTLMVDPLRGQKTGFYYDQRENREYIGRVVEHGSSVADLCCYSGAWSILAAKLGAARIVGIDSSETALSLAGENAALNGVETKIDWQRGDVEKKVLSLLKDRLRFDVVILDPPPLAKNRKTLRQAGERYRRLNSAAIQLTRRGGILFSSSCSRLMSRDAFRKILHNAAHRTGRYLRIVEWRGQAPDHPVLLAAPETEYLHCAVVQVI